MWIFALSDSFALTFIVFFFVLFLFLYLFVNHFILYLKKKKKKKKIAAPNRYTLLHSFLFCFVYKWVLICFSHNCNSYDDDVANLPDKHLNYKFISLLFHFRIPRLLLCVSMLVYIYINIFVCMYVYKYISAGIYIRPAAALIILP